MIIYGAMKVIKVQFYGPTLDRLYQPFGDASPMGLLWTFMAASEGYNVFTGLGEILGGVLLTTRRTTSLGALVCIAVMTHVVALNFCYDVAVKLFSLHLLGMAIFLAAHDLRRLANVFLLNRPTGPADLRPLFRRPWLHRAALTLRTALVAAFVTWQLYGAYRMRSEMGDWAPPSPLRGIWAVEEFAVDGVVHPLSSDPSRWRRVFIDGHKTLGIQFMSDSRERFNLELDADASTLTLKKRDISGWQTVVTYARPEPELLILEGEFDGRQVRARLRQAEIPEFRLLSRGFHWINECSYNK
jgi:hypothetical protein